MRFSDMMGSGDDRPSKQSGPSESEALITDALAPYLGTAASTTPSAPPPADTASEPVAPVAPVAPVEPVVPMVPVEPAAVPERPMSIADFAPVSDDLLPRRR